MRVQGANETIRGSDFLPSLGPEAGSLGHELFGTNNKKSVSPNELLIAAQRRHVVRCRALGSGANCRSTCTATSMRETY